MLSRIRPQVIHRGPLRLRNPHAISASRLPLVCSLTTTPQTLRPFLYRTRLVAKYSAYLVASTAFGLAVLTGGVFIHDAFTYTDKHVDRVPVSPLALHPQRGGPKNLPVVSAFLGDEEDKANSELAGKPRLVIVGGGWGVSISFFRRALT
jgi:hypothetical protein